MISISDINRFFDISRKRKRQLLLGVDGLLIVFCLGLALLIRGQSFDILGSTGLWLSLAVSIAVSLTIFDRLGLYRAVLRYITGASMRFVVTGAMAGAATFFSLSLGFAAFLPSALPEALPLGLIVSHALLVCAAIGTVRLWIRAMIRKPALRDCAPVIIYGAGHAGQQLVAALNLGLEYRPIAFVDDDMRLHGSTINGVRVHPAADLAPLIRQGQIRHVLMAMPSLNRRRRRRIVSRLETLGVEVKTIPAMGDLVAGRARFTDLRPVTPEDMLGRDPVPPQRELMQRNIAGKVVLVTGAGGSIGAELCRQIVNEGPATLVLLDVSEYALYAITTELRDRLGTTGPRLCPVIGSVQNAGRMRAVLRRFKVQTIYHAAAYKHVLLVEENPIEGLHNNVFGTQVLAEAASASGVESFTLVSTDKTVRPTNVMGATKRLAELICQAQAQKDTCCLFSIVRFGNVLGSSGSVIPRFRDQIERGGPVTVTHPLVTRYFMTICEAAQLVIQAGAMARGGDVFVLDMGEPVRILDLAKSMIRQHGLVPYLVDVDGVSNDEENGDIAIQITGLGHGEKLYEELLIAGNPKGTEHPRIMSESEPAIAPETLDTLLAALTAASRRFDVRAVQTLLLGAPIAYCPETRDIHDMVWEDESTITRDAKPLRVVSSL